MHNKTVTIIGAGLAGLSAAHTMVRLVLVFFVVAHTFSPIDLTPTEALEEAWEKVAMQGAAGSVDYVGAGASS